mmetsp:Transcript_2741/g.5182  ORF Transcript_2741/g.5182 Transcript_2741/m.5182 type:complete len:185 (-) Transcript_2741:311-865(-)
MLRSSTFGLGRQCAQYLNNNNNFYTQGVYSCFGSLYNTEPLWTTQKRFKHRFRREGQRQKLKNNPGAKDRFIFMPDGTVLRGPIAFKTKRVYTPMKKRQKKKNKFFEVKGKFVRKAKRLVPHWKKAYIRRWETKSLGVWYREHWQNLEPKQETPEVFKRALKEPQRVIKERNCDPEYYTRAYKI